MPPVQTVANPLFRHKRKANKFQSSPGPGMKLRHEEFHSHICDDTPFFKQKFIAWNLWYTVMFLSTPSIEELQSLELSALINMLVEETVAYIKLIERDGFSHESNACMEAITNLQVAIEARQNLEKKAP